jgi:hypothetical protein
VEIRRGVLEDGQNKEPIEGRYKYSSAGRKGWEKCAEQPMRGGNCRRTCAVRKSVELGNQEGRGRWVSEKLNYLVKLNDLGFEDQTSLPMRKELVDLLPLPSPRGEGDGVEFQKRKRGSRVLVTQVCNPSYSGGRDYEDRGLKPSWANSS